jgi:hypothetical protein
VRGHAGAIRHVAAPRDRDGFGGQRPTIANVLMWSS